MGSEQPPLLSNCSLTNLSQFAEVTGNDTNPEQHNLSLTTMVYVGLLIAIIFFAMLGNLLVISVFVFDRRLHVSSSYYVLSLAVSDIITASLVMTLEVDQFLSNFQWRHSKLLCEAWTTAYLFTVPVSILTACVSSVDRWYAIMRPLEYRTGRIRMKHKALCVIVLVWIYTIFFALLPKMGWGSNTDYNNSTKGNFCYFNIGARYSIVSSALNFILPALVTAGFYFSMFTVMKTYTNNRRRLSSASEQLQRSPSVRQKRNERVTLMRNIKLAKSYAVIGSLLIVTWCPFTILSIMKNCCELTQNCSFVSNLDTNVGTSLLMLGYFNSAVNPVVYVLRFRAFRTTIIEWFSCRKKLKYF